MGKLENSAIQRLCTILSINDNAANEILVPFFFTTERLHHPIFGKIAIEHMSQNYQSNEPADVLSECLSDKLSNIVESLVFS